MADVQESYPTPTTGLLKPVKIALSGTGVTQIKGNVYQVALSLGGTATVAVTAAAQDIAGASPSYAGAFNWVSRNALPASANSGDVVESYPASTSGKLGKIATVSGATGNPITVTGNFVGQAIVEVFIPFGDVDGSDNYLLTGGVYAQLIVTVGV